MKHACRTTILLGLSLAALATGAGAQPEMRLQLPSARATIKARIDAEQLLRGGRGPERTLPGTVSDEEQVYVQMTPEGEPIRVSVDQRLHVIGTGDYFVKIPGPVQTAVALPDSTAQPGVRSGSLVWQGFSADEEILGARVRLDPEHERDRLPLEATARLLVDGDDADLGRALSGDMALRVTLENRTGVETRLPLADVPARRAASALDTVRHLLSEGRRPIPGRDGLPRSLPTTSQLRDRSETVVAPLTVRIRVSSDRGISRIRFPGGKVRRAGSFVILTRRVLLSGPGTERTVRLRAQVTSARPKIEIEARPSLPSSTEVEPPGSSGWTAASASGRVDGRAMVERLVGVLAEVARLPDVDGYLGNPDRDGPAKTVYHYELVPGREEAQAAPRAPDPDDSGPSPARAILGVIVTLGSLAALIRWWALS